MIIIDAIQSALTILFMIGIGYFLTHKGWFDQSTSKLFSRFVINVALPFLMVTNLLKRFNKEMLMASGTRLLIPYAVVILTYGIGMIVSRLLKIPDKRRSLFETMFALSNTMFIGLPVNIALFGDESVPYVLLYFIANTTIFWTFGVYSIRKSATGEGGHIFTKETLKKIFSPPLIAFIISIGFILTGIRPPRFIMDGFKYIGSTTTALSMIFIGITIYDLDFSEIKIDKSMIALLCGRFIVCPLLAFVIVYYFPAPSLMKKVFVIESAMPVMTNTAIVAQAYKSDYKYATVMVSVSIMASLIIIPFYRVIVSML
ncbi:AEC family transporter [Lutibacter sp. B2]|nr:AEC family transporter [Lutibacter sp. B2]